MKISLLSHGDYLCGISTYTKYLLKALGMVGVDAKLVAPNNIGDPDIVFLTNIGLSNEVSNKVQTELSDKRLREIDKYWGKVPFAVTRHGLNDLPFFKRSHEYFKDKIFDLVFVVEDSEDMYTHIEQTLRFKSCVYVPLPAEFDDENFKDRSRWENRIISSGRMCSQKKTNIVLEIAQQLAGKKLFLITGEEAGTFWYFSIREHPGRKCVQFIGEYTDFREIYYLDAAFGIDLSYQCDRKGLISRNKIHYTGIEMVDCGVIPIGFDNWKPKRGGERGYDGIWLPSPKKIGRKMVFDVEACAKLIENYKYDFSVATRNREILKKRCDLRTVGEEYKHHFEKILWRRQR